MKKSKTIISGIKLQYILDYFQKIAAVSEPLDFYGPQWHIKIVPHDTMVYGRLNIPRNEIIFSGDSDTVDWLIDKYRMRFLSAGG